MVLLSSRFNEQNPIDEIVGEVMNNGTGSSEYVQALAVFRDASVLLVLGISHELLRSGSHFLYKAYLRTVSLTIASPFLR